MDCLLHNYVRRTRCNSGSKFSWVQKTSLLLILKKYFRKTTCHEVWISFEKKSNLFPLPIGGLWMLSFDFCRIFWLLSTWTRVKDVMVLRQWILGLNQAKQPDLWIHILLCMYACRWTEPSFCWTHGPLLIWSVTGILAHASWCSGFLCPLMTMLLPAPAQPARPHLHE